MDLRQSTARTVLVGPVLNADGSLYTTDDLDRTDFKITKNGTTGDLNASATVEHSHAGHFLIAGTADDFDTLGVGQISINSGTLGMPPCNFNVSTQAAWDAMRHATDGSLRADAVAISGDSTAADNLEASVGTIVPGTVSDSNTAPSATVFATDITEATANHFVGRVVIFTSGALQYQAALITAYALDTGEGKFTVNEMTDAPADGDTFIIV